MYRQRVEILFNALKSGVGATVLCSTLHGTLLFLGYAKVFALGFSRLLEILMKQKAGELGKEETGRPALVLALTPAPHCCYRIR